MWTPEDLAPVQADFLEFVESSGQTCDVRRPTEAQDALGATSRTFPTLIADNAPCVVIHDTGRMTFDDIADRDALTEIVEVLLPRTIDVRQGDQVITADDTFVVRRLDDVNTHSLIQHVWAVQHGRSA